MAEIPEDLGSISERMRFLRTVRELALDLNGKSDELTIIKARNALRAAITRAENNGVEGSQLVQYKDLLKLHGGMSREELPDAPEAVID